MRGGFERDRRWMIVDARGAFLTQRTHPRLSRVSVELRERAIVLNNELTLPAEIEGEPRDVVVWDDAVRARVHREADEWITRIVGEPAHLVYMPDDALRPVEDSVVSFADGYPILLASEASLAELSARAGQTFDMRRFRPNIAVRGERPFVEDELGRFRVGGVTMDAVKRCSRCSITTVDPDTGERGAEPLATLASFRQLESKVYFGVNVIPRSEGVIRVGDELARVEPGRYNDAVIRVRPAQEGDLERVSRMAGELVRMHHATDPARFMLIPDVEEGYAWWLGKQIENADAVVLVATREDEIVGYAYGSKEGRDWNMLLDAHGAVHDVYVAPAARRSGAGKMLIRALVERLEALGAARVVLHTMVSNEAAQKLFAACGFRPTMVEMTRSR